MSRPRRDALPALGFGLGYFLAGAALLAQELNLLTLRWAFVLPLIFMAVGIVIVVSSLLAAEVSAQPKTQHQHHPVP